MPTTIEPADTGAHLLYRPTLHRGVLIERYKRFLADVRLVESGQVVTAHCMNTGAMTGCAEPGSEVWLSEQNAPHRKLKWTWEIASYGGDFIGINTQLPNALVSLAVERGVVPELAGYGTVQREVTGQGRGGRSARFDIQATGHPDDPRVCWIEVKNVTLDDGGWARFPDAPTERGRRHLQVLADRAAAGDRAVAFYLVQRPAKLFAPARDVDPAYTRALQSAARRGVEVLAYQAEVAPEGVRLLNPLPVALTLRDERTARRGARQAGGPGSEDR